MVSKLRFPVLLIIAGLLALLAAGCGVGEDGEVATDDTPTDPLDEEDVPDDGQEDAPDDEVVTVRISSEAAPGTIAADMLDRFKEVTEERSDNLEVQVFIGGALYNDEEAVRAVSDGRLEMNMSVPSWMAGIEPGIAVFDLPYVFDDDEEFARVFDEEIGEILNQRLAARNVRGLTMIPMTGRIGIWMKEALPSDAVETGDLGGVSLRTFGGSPQQAAVEALGGRPVAIAAPEVPTSLETGVIEGVLTGIPAWGAQFGDELPFGVVPGAWHSGVVIWTNTEWWDQLPDDVRSALEFGVEDISQATRERVRDDEQALLDGADEAGHEIIILDEEQRAIWAERTADVAPQFEDDIGADIVEVITR